MKKLLVAFILLASCTNKKAQLVDLLRVKKDNLYAAQRQLDYYSDAKDGLSADEQIKGIHIFSKLVVDYQYSVDSIELELRKY